MPWTQRSASTAVGCRAGPTWFRNRTAGEGLQSDLDLVVVANKQERHGNMPAGSKDFDRKNNVEQVIVENPPPGEAVISVIAHSIAVAPQNYALVIRMS
ncbi:hypothetical protein IVA80_03430 [Bradyrhizobium sp. 139]|uniref:hypothetical protein n=1 Tax=Bradyrhizobium sp. 139 TaxID=2782616 RepID=UPI001FFA170B|nr:hypothetical protein [Bradyrhizobium sp. 139]MCK1739953.1 hypothetical protein [Bradyrhizobium sp. 139]